MYENSKPRNMCWGKTDGEGQVRQPKAPRTTTQDAWEHCSLVPSAGHPGGPKVEGSKHLCDSTKAQAERPRSQAGL